MTRTLRIYTLTSFLFLARPCVNAFALAVPPVVGAAVDGTSNGGFSPGVHLFPFRTESLSPGAPMVLPSSVGESVAANLTVICRAPPVSFVLAGGVLRLILSAHPEQYLRRTEPLKRST